MADEKRRVSLVITAQDQASAVLRGTSTVIRGIASKIGSAFAIAGKAASAINMGLELVKKALAAVGAAYELTIAKALALRGANDPARQDLEALTRSAESLGVAIGDALIPVVQAFAQAVTPAVRALEAWFRTHRDLIAQNVTGWLVDVGRILTSVVATAALLVARAWYGFGFAVDAVQAAAQAFFAAFAQGTSEQLGWMAKLARFAGQDGLAGRLDDLSAGAAGWAEAANKAAVANVDSMEKTGLELLAVERGIDKVTDAINTGLGSVAVNATKNLRAEVRLAGAGFADLERAADEAYAAIAQGMAETRAQAERNKLAELADAWSKGLRTVGSEYTRLAEQAQIQDQLNTGLEEMRRQWGGAADAAFAATGSLAGAQDLLSRTSESFSGVRDVVTSVLDSIGSAFTTMIHGAIEGTKTASELIGDFFSTIGTALLDTILGMLVQAGITAVVEAVFGAAVRKAAITGYAAEAGAAAYASTAAIPIIGPLLAPAAATAAYAGALAYQAKGLAEGGMFTGPGYSDSILTRVHPGEYYTPHHDVQRNLAEGRAPGDSGLPRRGEGGATAISVVVQSFVPPSRAGLDRAVHQGLGPSIRSNVRSGRLRLRTA